jgi:hypothetical protein
LLTLAVAVTLFVLQRADFSRGSHPTPQRLSLSGEGVTMDDTDQQEIVPGPRKVRLKGPTIGLICGAVAGFFSGSLLYLEPVAGLIGAILIGSIGAITGLFWQNPHLLEVKLVVFRWMLFGAVMGAVPGFVVVGWLGRNFGYHLGGGDPHGSSFSVDLGFYGACFLGAVGLVVGFFAWFAAQWWRR